MAEIIEPTTKTTIMITNSRVNIFEELSWLTRSVDGNCDEIMLVAAEGLSESWEGFTVGGNGEFDK
jgi:hypothetical protein